MAADWKNRPVAYVDIDPESVAPARRQEAPKTSRVSRIFGRLVGRRSPSAADSEPTPLERRISEIGGFRTSQGDQTAEALRRFWLLRNEVDPVRPKLAEWCLKHRPWIFGNVSRTWRAIANDHGVKEALREMPPIENGRTASPEIPRGIGSIPATTRIELARAESKRDRYSQSLTTLAKALDRRPRERHRNGEVSELHDRAGEIGLVPPQVFREVLTAIEQADDKSGEKRLPIPRVIDRLSPREARPDKPRQRLRRKDRGDLGR